MKLIFKYLKPYLLIYLLVVALTFLQVQTELALPDYMSDIVTNGIQYGGITESSPLAIIAEDMEKIRLFSDDEKIFASYELVEEGTKALVGKQEIEFKEAVYILKESSEELASLMEKPLVYAYIAELQGLEINESNLSEVLPKISAYGEEVKDNYGSMVRVYLSSLYQRVGVSNETLQSNYIIHTGMIMLLISFCSIFVQLASTYLATRTASKIAMSMRRDIFAKIESFSSSEFSRFSSSSLITRTVNDVTKLQELIQMMMRMMLMSPMMGLTAVFKVIRYPSISWLLLVAIGIVLGTMIFLLIVAVPKFEVLQKLTDRINSVVREFLDGMMVIRAFNAQEKEEEKFDDVNRSMLKTNRFVSYSLNVMGPIMTITMNGLTVLIAWFSAKAINIDVMSIGDMMAFSQYAMHVVMSFMMVTVTFFMIPRSLVSAHRIEAVLNTVNSIEDPKEPKVLPESNGKLVFEDVSFAYPGAEEKVLEHISFEANPGETVAFIGSTGSGKSTIVKLIPRLFDVTEGRITYCGLDLREVKQEDLHDRIGYATQKAVLFSGTIRSNIEFGRDVNADELQDAIRVSQSENILTEKEEGVEAPISQGGTNVSGGQKQRISIARTLAKKKNIYIFDDTFSALDYETDKKLRKELNEMIRNDKATVLIVAQRISTIRNADRIIVLNEGRIVGSGSHEELLENCAVYKEIAGSQLSEEELRYA